MFFNRVELMYGDLHAMLDGVADTARIFDGYIALNSEDISTLPPAWDWPAD